MVYFIFFFLYLIDVAHSSICTHRSSHIHSLNVNMMVPEWHVDNVLNTNYMLLDCLAFDLIRFTCCWYYYNGRLLMVFLIWSFAVVAPLQFQSGQKQFHGTLWTLQQRKKNKFHSYMTFHNLTIIIDEKMLWKPLHIPKRHLWKFSEN